MWKLARIHNSRTLSYGEREEGGAAGCRDPRHLWRDLGIGGGSGAGLGRLCVVCGERRNGVWVAQEKSTPVD